MLATINIALACRVDDEAEAYSLGDMVLNGAKRGLETELMGLNATNGTDFTLEELGKFFQVLGCQVSIVPDDVIEEL